MTRKYNRYRGGGRGGGRVYFPVQRTQASTTGGTVLPIGMNHPPPMRMGFDNPSLRRFRAGSCTVDIAKVPVHPYGIDPKALKFPLSGGKMLIISPSAKNHKYTPWNNNGIGHYSAAISYVQPYAPH